MYACIYVETVRCFVNVENAPIILLNFQSFQLIVFGLDNNKRHNWVRKKLSETEYTCSGMKSLAQAPRHAWLSLEIGSLLKAIWRLIENGSKMDKAGGSGMRQYLLVPAGCPDRHQSRRWFRK